jgi:hypothetical protein
MSDLSALYAQQYATNIMLLLQQKGSRLRGSVMEGTHYGEQASPVDQIGAIAMQPVTTRFNPMGRVDAALDRRWVAPSSFDLPQLVDSFDELKLLTDPKSKYVENAVNAAGRKFDELILAAALGAAQTGKTGTTSTAFLASNAVAVNFGASGNTGLTVAKLREGKRLLMANEVDLENDPLYLPVTATQHDNLLAEVQVISSDFNGGDMPVLKEGKIARFLGINFVHTELVTFSTYRLLPLYAKSGMHLGIWGDIKTDVRQRGDLSGLPWQAYVYMTAGSTRIEEKKVVKISCAES